MTSDPAWVPFWAFPNLSVDEAINGTFVALVPIGDERVRQAVERRVGLLPFLEAFRDEFGNHIDPSLMMFREDAPERVRCVPALASFRDAVCMSTLPLSHARSLKWGRPMGVQFSDAFQPYPWVLRDHNPSDEHIVAWTSAVRGLHNVNGMRAQVTPGIGETSLLLRDLDESLFAALLVRWDAFYGGADQSADDARLFRALDMARAASAMPGGSDAKIFDRGRAIGMWISAFEILAYDGDANLKRVVSLLRKAEWRHTQLHEPDRCRKWDKKVIESGVEGEIYAELLRIKNAFFHGKPVSSDTLRLPAGREALRFAAPLFRLALTAHLGLRRPAEPALTGGQDDLQRHLQWRLMGGGEQDTLEDAILLADTPPPRDRR